MSLSNDISLHAVQANKAGKIKLLIKLWLTETYISNNFKINKKMSKIRISYQENFYCSYHYPKGVIIHPW